MRPLLLGFLLVSCAPPLPLEGAPCPCVTGWVCCPGIALCAAEASRCEQVLGPEVSPLNVEVATSRIVQFTSSAQGVIWEMEEGLIAGSIDSNGRYIAPPEAGVVHVIARTSLGATRVTVTVRELRMQLLAGQYGGPSLIPIDGVGEQARLSFPSGGVFAGGHYYFVDRSDDVGASLRRLEPVSQRVETLRGFDHLEAVASAGDKVLLRIGADRATCVHELNTTDFSTVPVFCAPWPGLPFGVIIGDGEAFYATRGNSLLRVERDGGESVLAGLVDVEGEADAGLLSGPDALAISGTTLYVVDHEGSSIHAVDTQLKTITTLAHDLPIPISAIAVSIDPGPVQDLVTLDSFGMIGIGPPFGRGSRWGSSGAYAMAFEAPRSMLLTGPDVISRVSLSNGSQTIMAGRVGRPASGVDGDGPSAGFDFDRPPILAVAGDMVFVAEPDALTIRAVTRGGEVSTPFTNVRVRSMVVDASHVYVISEGAISRAARAGGPWETLPLRFSRVARFLGQLNDGRIAMMDPESATISFLVPSSFTLDSERFEQLGALADFGEAVAVLDPSGGVYFGWNALRRFDFATRQVTELSSQSSLDQFGRNVLGPSGELYVINGELVIEGIKVFVPELHAWVPFIRQPLGAVFPGPLSRAMLHEPSALGVFPNGDLIIADGAEHTLLVVE